MWLECGRGKANLGAGWALAATAKLGACVGLGRQGRWRQSGHEDRHPSGDRRGGCEERLWQVLKGVSGAELDVEKVLSDDTADSSDVAEDDTQNYRQEAALFYFPSLFRLLNGTIRL